MVFLLSATYAEAALKYDNFDDNSTETDFWAVYDVDANIAETNQEVRVDGGADGTGGYVTPPWAK